MERAPSPKKETAGPRIPPSYIIDQIERERRERQDRRDEEGRRIPLEIPLPPPPGREKPRGQDDDSEKEPNRGVIIMDMAGEEDSKEDVGAPEDHAVIVQMDDERNAGK